GVSPAVEARRDPAVNAGRYRARLRRGERLGVAEIQLGHMLGNPGQQVAAVLGRGALVALANLAGKPVSPCAGRLEDVAVPAEAHRPLPAGALPGRRRHASDVL